MSVWHTEMLEMSARCPTDFGVSHQQPELFKVLCPVDITIKELRKPEQLTLRFFYKDKNLLLALLLRLRKLKTKRESDFMHSVHTTQ